MPRDGAVVLSDLRNPTLSILCDPCGRRGRLMEQHGDAKLTDLLQTRSPIARRRARFAFMTDVGHAMSVTRGVEPPPPAFEIQPGCVPRGSAR